VSLRGIQLFGSDIGLQRRSRARHGLGAAFPAERRTAALGASRGSVDVYVLSVGPSSSNVSKPGLAFSCFTVNVTLASARSRSLEAHSSTPPSGTTVFLQRMLVG